MAAGPAQRAGSSCGLQGLPCPEALWPWDGRQTCAAATAAAAKLNPITLNGDGTAVQHVYIASPPIQKGGLGASCVSFSAFSLVIVCASR